MKTILCLIGFVAASCSFAADFPEKNGYLIDGRGEVVRNNYRECWHTGYWTPLMAIAECDADLVKKPEPKVVSAVPPTILARRSPEPVALPLIRLSQEALFDFDRADVRPEGRKILNETIITGMKLRAETTLLRVTGHADRIGTEKYNQDLSERRAYAVKNYLQQQGVNAQRISASGKGKSEPDPIANTRAACKGMRGGRLIACLQPDRRVTVESVEP